MKVRRPLKKFEGEAEKEGSSGLRQEAKDDDFNIHSGAVKNMVLGQGN